MTEVPRDPSVDEKLYVSLDAAEVERSACFWYAWYASKVLKRVWLYMLLASLSSRLCVDASVCGGGVGMVEDCADSVALKTSQEKAHNVYCMLKIHKTHQESLYLLECSTRTWG